MGVALILIDLSVRNCSYSLAKKDTNLRPVAQKTHAIFARELASIYEVKIPARQLILVFKGLSTLGTHDWHNVSFLP